MNELKKILQKLDATNPMSYRLSRLFNELKDIIKEIDIQSITYKNKVK